MAQEIEALVVLTKYSISCFAPDLLHVTFSVSLGIYHKPNAEHLFSSITQRYENIFKYLITFINILATI